MFGIQEFKLDELIDEFVIGNVVSLSLEDEIMIFTSQFEIITDEEIIKEFSGRTSKEELTILIASLRKCNLI